MLHFDCALPVINWDSYFTGDLCWTCWYTYGMSLELVWAPCTSINLGIASLPLSSLSMAAGWLSVWYWSQLKQHQLGLLTSGTIVLLNISGVVHQSLRLVWDALLLSWIGLRYFTRILFNERRIVYQSFEVFVWVDIGQEWVIFMVQLQYLSLVMSLYVVYHLSLNWY